MGQHLSLSPSAPTKSFVLEVHTQAPTDYLDDLGDGDDSDAGLDIGDDLLDGREATTS